VGLAWAVEGCIPSSIYFGSNFGKALISARDRLETPSPSLASYVLKGLLA